VNAFPYDSKRMVSGDRSSLVRRVTCLQERVKNHGSTARCAERLGALKRRAAHGQYRSRGRKTGRHA